MSPFFRATRDQLQNFYIDPQGGLESGLNVGNQQSSGVELAVQKGDFSREGLSGQLAFTYTHSQIKYQNFSGTSQNVIDQLNSYIQQYDGFIRRARRVPVLLIRVERFGRRRHERLQAEWRRQRTRTTTSRIRISSPDGAWYTTYDVIPGPVAAANGYAVPYVVAMILNYRHKRFAVTNSWNFTSGASYGAPTAWPGYLPSSCYQPPAALAHRARQRGRSGLLRQPRRLAALPARPVHERLR